MNTIYKKKLLGTGIFAVAILALIGFTFATASARLVSNQSNVIMDGIVSDVSNATVSIVADGSEFTFAVDNKTVFSGQLDFGDIALGDALHILGKHNDNNLPIAKVVKRTSQAAGYGVTGPQVITQHAIVVSTTATSITVETGSGMVTYMITPSTNVFPGDLSGLNSGDEVTIIGEQVGSIFVARIIKT